MAKNANNDKPLPERRPRPGVTPTSAPGSDDYMQNPSQDPEEQNENDPTPTPSE